MSSDVKLIKDIISEDITVTTPEDGVRRFFYKGILIESIPGLLFAVKRAHIETLELEGTMPHKTWVELGEAIERAEGK